MYFSNRAQKDSVSIPTIISLFLSLRLNVQILIRVSIGTVNILGRTLSACCCSKLPSGRSKRMPPYGPCLPKVFENKSLKMIEQSATSFSAPWRNA